MSFSPLYPAYAAGDAQMKVQVTARERIAFAVQIAAGLATSDDFSMTASPEYFAKRSFKIVDAILEAANV